MNGFELTGESCVTDIKNLESAAIPSGFVAGLNNFAQYQNTVPWCDECSHLCNFFTRFHMVSDPVDVTEMHVQ